MGILTLAFNSKLFGKIQKAESGMGRLIMIDREIEGHGDREMKDER